MDGAQMSSQQRVGVIGYGVTGKSVVAHLLRQGKTPVVIDTRPEPDDFNTRGEHFFAVDRWPEAELCDAVLSPGLAMDAPLVQSALEHGVELCSDIDLFFDRVQQPVIGVTGTNGKSTVVSLAGHLLASAGYRVAVGGNLGTAALDLLIDPQDIYVLELSSFQLERSREHAYAVAVILNISEDHADQHGGMDAYVEAKHRIYSAALKKVLNRDDAVAQPRDLTVSTDNTSFGQQASATGWGVLVDGSHTYIAHGEQRVADVADLSLSGLHNHLNVAATCALVEDWLTHEQIAAGLKSFTGLAHRFETIAESSGVRFVNDSKATNVGATEAALAGFDMPGSVVLIAGGDAKGADLTPLVAPLRAVVDRVLAIGRDAEQVLQVAHAAGVQAQRCADLQVAVEAAFNHAVAGQTVLLSPACASLDMFTNYAARGDEFRQAVAARLTHLPEMH